MFLTSKSLQKRYIVAYFVLVELLYYLKWFVVLKVFFQSQLFILVTSVSYPVNKSPHALKDDSIEYLRSDDLAHSRLCHVVQL